MPTDFSQWLTFLLIALLFGKDNVLPALMRKFGLTEEKPPPKLPTDELAEALRKVFVDDDKSPILVKSRITRICDDIKDMKEDIAFIKGKLDT